MDLYPEDVSEQFDRLLNAVGYLVGERISVCHRKGGSAMKASVVYVSEAPMKAAEVANGSDVYFGTGVLSHDFESDGYARGAAKDVVRIPALVADLDANEGKLKDEANCREVVDNLSAWLGRPPAAIVHSGSGGLHPYWPLEFYEPSQHRRAKRLLKQFGKVVQVVAARVGGAADEVFDSTRLLRVPGTENQKPTGGLVTVEFPDVAPQPLTLDELDAMLNPAATYSLADRAEWNYHRLTSPASSDGPMDYLQATVELVGLSAALNTLDPYSQEYVKAKLRGMVKKDLAAMEAGPPPPPDQSRLDLKALVDPNRPPRAWFWQGLIPEGDHVSIIAPGGTGKSLLALSLSVMAVRDAPCFIGRELSLPEDRKVMYIDMENSEDDWAERLVDLGVTPDEVDQWGDRFIPLGMPALRGLDTEHGATQLLEMVDHFGITKGDVLVLDSTQRLTEGEENSSDVIRRMYTLCSSELKRRGITVIRTDNTGKDTSRGARGTSAKADDVGYSLVLERDEKDAAVFTLSSGKHRSKVTEDENRLVFRRSNDPATGRLTFEPTKSTYPAKLAEVSGLLEQLGVPASAGQRTAWRAWQQGLTVGTFTPPTWRVTQSVVHEAQKGRDLLDGMSHVVP